MPTVLIVGSTGQLGTELHRVYAVRKDWQVCAPSHGDLELADAAAVGRVLREVRPAVVLNCAAYNKVEAAETDPGAAFAVNTSGVAALAAACRAVGSLLVHFSTDYVFDGHSNTPYSESDAAHPVNVYGLSKLAGEEAVRLLHPHHCIVRTCGLYGHARSAQGKLNFVEAILAAAERGQALEVRGDLVCTPTAVAALAPAVVELVEHGVTGTVHVTNTGWCSWLEFAREILRQQGLSQEVRPVSAPSAGARRPRWSVLSLAKLHATGIRPLSSWQDALATYLTQRPHGLTAPR